MTRLFIGAAALCAMAACSKGGTAADSTRAGMSPDDSAAVAARAANAIKANPVAADSILRAAGFTRDSYQAFLYRVAADSGMSAAYASAKQD